VTVLSPATWLLYLPFAPFAVLREVISGRSETGEEREAVSGGAARGCPERLKIG
jgi:hypothetical protein